MPSTAVADLLRLLSAEAVDASCAGFDVKPEERPRYWVLSAWLVRGEVQSKPRNRDEAMRMGKIALEYELPKAPWLAGEVAFALEAGRA